MSVGIANVLDLAGWFISEEEARSYGNSFGWSEVDRESAVLSWREARHRSRQGVAALARCVLSSSSAPVAGVPVVSCVVGQASPNCKA